MSIRTRPLALAWMVVLAVGATACGPPQEPLRVGMREVASNVVLGGGADDVDVPPAPVPPTAVSVTVPDAINVSPPTAPAGPPPPPPPLDGGPDPGQGPDDGGSGAPPPANPAPSPTASPPPPECRRADPRTAPRLEAPRDRMTPPVEAAYTFRNKGGFEVSGADANEGVFDQWTRRSVTDVTVQPEGHFTFSVEAELAGTVTTSTYEYRNAPLVPGSGDVADQADYPDGRGLYLRSIVTRTDEGPSSRFAPANPLLLLPMPATNGTRIDVAGTDPTSGTTMSYALTVVGKQRVDACDEPLDAIRVRLTDGRIVGPQTAVDFNATYDFGSQFGGLMLRDAFVMAGREGLNNVSRNNVATINDVPRTRRR